MDARLYRAALIAAAFLSLGASYRTTNFLVYAPSDQLAREIGDRAEVFRRDLAVEWLGAELPPWSGPCPITAKVGPAMGAGGATSFMFENGRPFGWRMTIQGSRERILDSVLPHEITHTIFATHFGCPLPRWADEGACTTVEHVSERKKQEHFLIQFLKSRPSRGIAFNQMFAMREYPTDVLPLYSQGYSLARFLIAQGGKRKFVQYVGDGMRHNNWTAATKQHYGFVSLSQLQTTWLDWVRRGSPPLQRPATALAQQASPDGGEELAPAASKLAVVPNNPVAADASDLLTDKADQEPEKGSWYARQARQAATSPAAVRPGRAIPRSDTQSLSRPQGYQQPQQIILEWNRPPAPATPLPGSAGGGVRTPVRQAGAAVNGNLVRR